MDEIMEFYKNNTEWIIIIVSINLMAIILYAILSNRRQNKVLLDTKKEIEQFNKHQEENQKLLDGDTAISEEFIRKFNELTDEPEIEEEFAFENPADGPDKKEIEVQKQPDPVKIKEEKIDIIPIVTLPEEEVKEEKDVLEEKEELAPLFVASDEFEEEDEELIDFTHLDNYDYFDSREEPIIDLDVNQLINDELEQEHVENDLNVPVEPFLYEHREEPVIEKALEEYIPTRSETSVEVQPLSDVAPFVFEEDEDETIEFEPKKDISKNDFIISPVHGIIDPIKRQDFLETQKIERTPEMTSELVDDYIEDDLTSVDGFDESIFDEFASNFDLASGKTTEIVVPEFDVDDFDDEEGELIDLRTLEKNNYDLDRINKKMANGSIFDPTMELEIEKETFEKLSRENTPLEEKINDDNKFDSYLKKLKEFRASL
jgi:cell division protein FtsB